mmetsp:Transcript_96230/g.250693  ORF Transcript_96230/g.250693 Transcript_96230/m.250693 type:complete len:219 (+) Transcript_96230:830-1486(+)
MATSSERAPRSRAPCVPPWTGVAARGGRGQPGSVLLLILSRNSTLSSCPEPGNRVSRACSLSAWMRPRKSDLRDTSGRSALIAVRLSRSPRQELSAAGCSTSSELRSATGAPESSISLSVCAWRSWRSARMSWRRSCSMSVKTFFQVSSFCILAAIMRMASRSRFSTVEVSTFFSSFTGCSSRRASKVSKRECTSRRARRCGAQLPAVSRCVRLSFWL